MPEQLLIAVTIPSVTVLVGILISNHRAADLRAHFDDKFQHMERLMDARFETARADLRRVEEVMDARLTRIEHEIKLR